MSLRRSALIAVVIILGCSLITLFAAFNLTPPGFASPGPALRGLAGQGFAGDGFALLTLDAAYPDRAVGERLSGAGINGYISESTVWVFLDDFGELKRIPLDAYDEAVEPFDPRNDGYAEKLRSFFVENGKRRFFLGLNDGYSGANAGATYEQLEGRIAAALGENAPGENVFTLDAFVTARPGSRLWPLLLFLAASAGALILALSGLGLPRASGLFVPRSFFFLVAALLPVLGALAFSGPGGFACSAALLGCFQSLLPPFRENYSGFQRLRGHRLKFDRIFRINWLLAILFLLVFIGIAVLTSIHPLLAVLTGAGGFTVFGLFLWVESKRGTSARPGTVHRRFEPVPIREPVFSFTMLPRIVLPFAVASFLALFLPLLASPAKPAPPFTGGGLLRDSGLFYRESASLAAILTPPSKEEYEAHFTYQASFSLRPLDASPSDAGRPEGAAYRSYYLGGDGLIAGSRDMADPAVPEYPGIPPFPLEELASFLERGGNYTVAGNRAGDVFAAVVLMLLAVPSCFGFFRERRKMRSFLVLNNKGDKQAAA
jgi:hypothetical protein